MPPTNRPEPPPSPMPLAARRAQPHLTMLTRYPLLPLPALVTPILLVLLPPPHPSLFSAPSFLPPFCSHPSAPPLPPPPPHRRAVTADTVLEYQESGGFNCMYWEAGGGFGAGGQRLAGRGQRAGAGAAPKRRRHNLQVDTSEGGAGDSGGFSGAAEPGAAARALRSAAGGRGGGGRLGAGVPSRLPQQLLMEDGDGRLTPHAIAVCPPSISPQPTQGGGGGLGSPKSVGDGRTPTAGMGGGGMAQAGGGSSATDKAAQAQARRAVVKGPWTVPEDDRLIQLVNQYGPKKWKGA